MSVKPLAGIKVLDLSKVLAGPICAQFLGDLGADVIKVEPLAGDDTRQWIPKRGTESTFFLSVNFNKRSVAVDLKTSEGKQIVYDLVKNADVFIQGFRKATVDKLEMGYEQIKKLNSKIVYCEISGYGRTGPMGDEPGYDAMLQAFSGMLSTMGQPNGEYARASFSPIDLGTGQNALSGILAALIGRSHSGSGVYLEVSLLDTAMTYMSYLAQSYWVNGSNPKRWGTAHPTMCPYQAFRTKDSMIMIGAGNDSQWTRFCHVVGLDNLLNDPDLATNSLRVKNMEKTVTFVQKRLLQAETQHWLDALLAVQVPCAPINSLSNALETPQIRYRGTITSVQHPTLGVLQRIAYPVIFNNQPRVCNIPPPLLGQHSTDVLTELGYSEAQIQKMYDKGVITTYDHNID